VAKSEERGKTVVMIQECYVYPTHWVGGAALSFPLDEADGAFEKVGQLKEIQPSQNYEIKASSKKYTNGVDGYALNVWVKNLSTGKIETLSLSYAGGTKFASVGVSDCRKASEKSPGQNPVLIFNAHINSPFFRK
jgi:hypothetical protein